MSLQFTKMHGLGNDFMVIQTLTQTVDLSSERIAAWARRDTGIGFDQCLVIQASECADVDFQYRIFNADGREVGQCGNGARCIARYLLEYGFTQKKRIRVATATTQLELQVHQDGLVTVAFEPPVLEPVKIPIVLTPIDNLYVITLADGSICEFRSLQVGNPHAIIPVSDLNNIAVQQIGAELSTHAVFPEHANVSFMQIINPTLLRVRVYERGVGITRACGSAALACAIAARLWYAGAAQIQIELDGGSLRVEWPEREGAVYLIGPAEFVYNGILLPKG
ncbi:MAG: diaminopimelate epimerase [Legionellaceae bacterium]|nr:diaminopimelate epimerase [Legionellaceae bacterium]